MPKVPQRPKWTNEVVDINDGYQYRPKTTEPAEWFTENTPVNSVAELNRILWGTKGRVVPRAIDEPMTERKWELLARRCSSEY